MARHFAMNLVVVLVLGTIGYGAAQSYVSPSGHLGDIRKAQLNQTGYVEYTEYDAKIPSLTGFTIHYWFNLDNTRRTSTTFNYAIDELSTNNNLTIQLVNGSPQRWTLQINDQLVSSIDSPLIRAGEWHHMFHSWDSTTGLTIIFMDGKIIGLNRNPKSIGMVIPGGGVPVSGQHQNTATFGGMDQGEGIEGWFTLFQMSSLPLQNPYARVTHAYLANIPSQCTSPDYYGDLISWQLTPRRGYGGIAESPGNQICGNF